jgi:hypothetical protein
VSCEKEELPVKLPPKPENVKLGSADMTEQYDRQVFVNLITGQQWTADNDDWDLQLDAQTEGCLIRLNGGKGVLVAAVGKDNFGPVNVAGLNWRWDGASGMSDSLALGGCYISSTQKITDSIYVIDRGFAVPEPERYYQFSLSQVSDSHYKINTANLEGSNVQQHTITKHNNKLHVYFTFANGGKPLNIEPDKNEWHFCFTRYRWIYYEFTPPLLYTVVGVHINSGKIAVAVDSTMKFENITHTEANTLPFSNRRDIIGFEWKYPDFTATGVRYISRKYVNFIIRETDSEGETFKLRFIDFYNDLGVKGTPRYEYMRIY